MFLVFVMVMKNLDSNINYEVIVYKLLYILQIYWNNVQSLKNLMYSWYLVIYFNNKLSILS